MQVLPHRAVAAAVFLLIVAAYAVMAFHFPVAYIWATYEDLVGEWAQTYFFFAAAVLAALAALQKSRYRWFFAVLTLACCYVFLEEISWGQRIIGFDTPEYLKARNLQGEANLHNLFTGPHKTLLKDLISIGLALALVAYGLVYPVMHAAGWRLAHWADKLGVAGPPLYLWPFFTLAGLFELKPLSFNEAEIAELLIAAALAMTSLHYLFGFRRGRASPVAALSRNESFVFGRWLVVLVVAVVTIAGVTTVAFYSVPENRVRIDSRIENGIEKFAGRYERKDRCDIANDLYAMLLVKQPDRVYIMRKMAACHRELGHAAEFDEIMSRAIARDLEKYDEEPWRASVNQSLVRSYRLVGDTERADAHLAKALDIGLSRISEHPGSASAAYSYGRTLQLAGRKQEAFEQFSRAYELKPTSSRYRKAYFASRAALR